MDGSQAAPASFAADDCSAVLCDSSVGSTHWRVAPDWQSLLADPRGLPLDEWSADGRLHTVKHAVHRTVYRIELPEGAVFLKHYRVLSLVNALTHLLRGSAARREWRNAIEVCRRGVPTAAPVALGERRRAGLVRDSYYMSEAIANACTLEYYVDVELPRYAPAEQARLRRNLALALARLCATAHHAGVYHTDFHRGNVLLSLDASATIDGLPRLYLIDLPKMRFSGPLSWGRTRASLAMFAPAWLERTSQSELWRFWKAYLAARPELSLADPTAAANDIVRRSRAHVKRILRRRDRRALATNRDYYRLETQKRAGCAVRGLSRDDFLAVLNDPEKIVAAANTNLYSDRADRRMVKTQFVIDGAPQAAALTYTEHGGGVLASWWSAIVGPARAIGSRRGWYVGQALRERGITTARPLFFIEERSEGERQREYLATTWVEGAALSEFLLHLRDLPAAERRTQTRRCATALGRWFGRLHAWDASYAAPQAPDFRVVESAESLKIVLTDVAGVRLTRGLSMRRRAREIAALVAATEPLCVISRRDKLRFLRAYAAAAVPERIDWRALWRQIARHV